MKEQINCSCQHQSLVITRRQVGYLTAGTLVVSFFVFMAGYFLGHAKASNRLCAQVEQESFSDAIGHSLTTQFGAMSGSQEDTCSDVSPDESLACLDPVQQEDQHDAPVMAQVEQIEAKPLVTKSTTLVPGRKHQALLFGGSKNDVQAFVSNMATLGFPVESRRRVSSTKKGTKRVWFQAVTTPMEDRQQVASIAEQIKKRGRLKDVRIIEIG
jgi:hypothetical protein